jgi:hypothetical protein
MNVAIAAADRSGKLRQMIQPGGFFIAAGFLTQAAAPALRSVVLPEVNSNCSSLDLAQLFDLSAVLEGYNFDKLFLFLNAVINQIGVGARHSLQC